MKKSKCKYCGARIACKNKENIQLALDRHYENCFSKKKYDANFSRF
jgi:hypothetical protein